MASASLSSGLDRLKIGRAAETSAAHSSLWR